MNVGLGDAADEQHLRQPAHTGGHGDGRHAGQRHPHVHRASSGGTCRSPATAGTAGFDAADPHLRFHTYTGGQMDVNYNDVDPTSWLWIGDRFIVNFTESQRFYAPVDLRSARLEDDLRRGAARVADAELPEAIGPSWRRTAIRPSASSRAISSTPARAARRRSGRRSARRRSREPGSGRRRAAAT